MASKNLQKSEDFWSAPIPTTGEAFVVLFDRWYRERANRFAAQQPCPSSAEISALYVDLSSCNPRLYGLRSRDSSADKSSHRASSAHRDLKDKPDHRSGFKSPSAKRSPRQYPTASWDRLVDICTKASACATWNGNVRDCTRKKSASGNGCTTSKGDLAHSCPRCKQPHKFAVAHRAEM